MTENIKPKRRFIYFYECIRCHKKRRSTVVYLKAKERVCKKCKKIEIDERQMKLFDLPDVLQSNEDTNGAMQTDAP